MGWRWKWASGGSTFTSKPKRLEETKAKQKGDDKSKNTKQKRIWEWKQNM